jgi:hypothetical protein
MRRRNGYVRVIGGAIVALLAASFAGIFVACEDSADDCNNTLSCPVPDYCLEAGDAYQEVDGCF